MKKRKKYMLPYNKLELTTEDKAKILETFPLFFEVSENEIIQFASKMIPRIIRPREIFVEEDIDEKQAFFVYKGMVSVFRTTPDGEYININIDKAPELVGEMGLIDTKPSPASAMAIDECHSLVLAQEDFTELIKDKPILALRFLKLFSDRIRDFNFFLEHLLSKNLYERTWQLLQHLGDHFQKGIITLSHEELSDLIWGTRARVSEVLTELESEGKIITSRRKIIVLKKD